MKLGFPLYDLVIQGNAFFKKKKLAMYQQIIQYMYKNRSKDCKILDNSEEWLNQIYGCCEQSKEYFCHMSSKTE